MISTSTQLADDPVGALDLAHKLLDVLPHVGMAVAHAARRREQADPNHLNQIYTLRALDRGACSFRQLIAARRVSAPTLSRSIEALVKRGWVERIENPEDRRQVLLKLSRDGQVAFDEMRLRTLTHIATRLQGLSAPQLETISEALTILDSVFGEQESKSVAI